eukprot:gene703-964_t
MTALVTGASGGIDAGAELCGRGGHAPYLVRLGGDKATSCVAWAFQSLNAQEKTAKRGGERPDVSRLVMKFGGTSVADLERIRRVARLVAAEVATGKQIAGVVSAMAGKTNELVAWTDGAGPAAQGLPASDDEYDMVVASGEFVVVIGPPAADAQTMTAVDLDAMLRASLAHDSVKDAVAHAVEVSGRPRREIYARALELKRKADGGSMMQPEARVAAPERVAAFHTGISAESRAAAWLMAKGYSILARRFRTPHGEIDIVARKRSLIAF